MLLLESGRPLRLEYGQAFFRQLWSVRSLPGLFAWYDASDKTLITQSGDEATGMAEKSGSGYNLARNTGAGWPGPDTGINAWAGRNVLTYDGTETKALATFVDTGTVQPWTSFNVVRVSSTGAARVYDNSTGARSLLHVDGAAEAAAIHSGVTSAGVACPSDEFVAVMALHNGSASKIQVNNMLTVGLNAGTDGIGGFYLGDDGGGSVDSDYLLAEHAFCSGDQSSHFNRFWRYAQRKWRVA